MTGADVKRWLETRRPAPPAALQTRLYQVVDQLAAGSKSGLPELLADAGRQLLARVAARPDGGRELALDLLAADALVTYAFEAQAEMGVSRLAQLAAESVR